MKKLLGFLIISGFILFFVGGFILVFTQIIGLLCFNQLLVIEACRYFFWIFPVTGFTGLLCWLYSYIKKEKKGI